MSSSYSSYDRGRRGGGRERDYGRSDNRDHKRQRDDSQGRRPPRGKFQKRGGGRGRGRGGKRQERPEFSDVITTRPEYLTTKSALGTTFVAKDQPLQLITNYFEVNSSKKVSMKMYRVDFYPPTENKRFKFEIINETKNILGLHVFDGANCIYLMQELPQDDTNLEVKLRTGEKFDVRYRKSREILYTDAMFFTILNLIVRRCFDAIDLKMVGRHYYDPAAAKEVRELKGVLWPGYITSIRQHEDSLLLCCELNYKLVREENIWETIQDIIRKGKDYRTEVARAIIGTTVITTYNNKKYRINEIDWNSTVGKSSFMIDGRKKSYAEYYKERYNRTNLDPDQFLLLSKAKAKNIRGGSSATISLLPELCQPTGVNDSMRHNFQMMKQLSEHTRMTPQERVSKLLKFSQRLHSNKICTQTFKDNNLSLGRDLVKVDARRLEQEKVYFGTGEPIELNDAEPGQAADWTKALRNNEMRICKRLDRWVFICPKKFEQDGMSFINKMIETGTRMGMEIQKDFCKEILPDDRIPTYVQAICKHQKRDPSFMVIVVENIREDRYAAIKKTCYCSQDVKNPIPTQVLCAKTISETRRNVMSVATKVAIQINCKLGGIPWVIPIPLKGLLVIGFDVTHDTSDRSKSFSAMVASIDPHNEGGKFFCCANKHSTGDIISDKFGQNVLVAVKKYHELLQELPKRIIIYRDGVGDGQIEYVRSREVNDIVSKINRLYGYDPEKSDPELEPQVGFIIVNKKINTRFFVPKGPQGRADNPLPGTVVDSVVTLPERYDFYLISQSVTQGTVSPIAYNVIYDRMMLQTAHIQKLSFKLCHTYFNWSGTTRVPSVVQYAKKLALLIGQHLHHEPTGFSDDRMLYFL